MEKTKEKPNVFSLLFYTPNQVYLFKREKQSILFSKFIPYFAYKKSKDFFLKISINLFYIPKKKYIKIYIYAKIGINLATKMCFFRHMLVKIVKKNILVAVVLIVNLYRIKFLFIYLIDIET